MKRILIFSFFMFFAFSVSAYAAQETESLYDALGGEEKSAFSFLGIESADYSEILNLDIKKLFSFFQEKLREEIKKPFKFAAQTSAVLILYAAFMSFEKGDTPLRKTVSLSCVLVCSLFLIIPVCEFLESSALLISSSGKFLLSASSVYSALLYMGGQASFASSYNYMAVLSGNVITFVFSYVASPVLNVFLGFSVVSGMSERYTLKSFCDFFYKTVRIVLAFSLTVFTAVLSLQTAVFTSADAAIIKTARFAVSSFVPAVGSAISDAVTSVYSSVKLLRSGAGAFGILAAIIIFSKSLISYAIWKIMCSFTLFVSETFEIKNVSALLKSAEKTLDIMAALLVSCMAVIIIVSGAIFAAGKV